MQVCPRLDQILGPQRRVRVQEFGLAGSEPSRLDEQPHGNPRPNDAGLATADIRPAVDSRETIVELGDDISHEPRLFTPGETTDQIDSLFKNSHSSHYPRRLPGAERPPSRDRTDLDPLREKGVRHEWHCRA